MTDGDQTIRSATPKNTCYMQTSRRYLIQILWSWPSPDVLHIWTRRIHPGDTLDMQIWTSYIKTFESYGLTDIQTSYMWSFPIMWQRWQSHHWICHTWQTHATCKRDGSMFSRTGVMGDWSLQYGNRNFRLFCSWDLDLAPMTFIYESDPYSREIHWMCKYELPTSRLSKVIIWQTIYWNYKPRCFMGDQN